MKKQSIQLIFILFVFLIIGCSETSQPQEIEMESQDIAEDSTAILNTLENWYGAMYALDSIGILAALTPNFILIEDTLMLSGADLIARLKGEGGPETWHAEFRNLNTRFLGDVAWTTLRNHETAEGSDGLKCQADYLETIVFVREGERWLIDRYHAAVLNAWTCEE